MEDALADPYGDSPVRVRWTCALFVGPPKWRGTEVYEPDECGNEFETIENAEDWAEKTCSAVCPKCKQLLTQRDDLPEIVEGA